MLFEELMFTKKKSVAYSCSVSCSAKIKRLISLVREKKRKMFKWHSAAHLYFFCFCFSSFQMRWVAVDFKDIIS